MSDFMENENLNAEEEELSTVFSDPTAHKEVKVKKKKLLPKILAGVLALAILAGGTVAVIKLIPVPEEEEFTPDTPETIEVKKIDTDKVSAVTVTNSAGTVELYSDLVEDDTTESEGDQKVAWFTKQVNKSLTESYNIEKVVNTVTNISSTLKITKKTAEECGLSDAKTKAVVTPNDGKVYTVLLGDKSPDNSGYYLKIEGEDIIYLVDEEVYETLQFELLDFAATPTIAGFDKDDEKIASALSEDGTIMDFDRMEISGENYPETVVILPNDDDKLSEYYGFIVKSPQVRLAQNIENVTALFQTGIAPSGAYSYDVTSSTLKKLGLDKPDIQIMVNINGRAITYKMDLQADGNYAVISESSPVVYKVAASTLATVAGYKTADYYLPTIFLTNIENISNFTVNTPEKSYSFDIVKNEEAKDDDEDDYIVTINGKRLVSDNFQNFYAECISLVTKDYINDNLTSKPEISFVMTLKNGGKSTVEFTKINATRYQCKLDGIGMGRVTSSSLNGIVQLVEKTANGEKIEFY